MPETVHAGCVTVGEAGILIRGASGAGKSSLARELLLHACKRNLFAVLVSDDRTRLEARHGRLIARPVPDIAGHLEVRGVGIVHQAFEPSAVLRLVVDLSAGEPERCPEGDDRFVTLCGVVLPRLRARTGAPLADIVLGALTGKDDLPVVTL